MLTACGGLNGDDGTGNVTITLPNVSAAPSANAKAVGRSISPDAIAGLRRDTVRYRVHMNNRVLEGTGGNFSANFPVGLKVDVYVECIGSGGNVIIRTDVKTIVVRSRQNSVDINLQTDGTVVGQPQPSAPQPVTGQVKYYVGNANAADGVMPPTDGTTYTAGDEVTVSAAPRWAYGTFNHWQASDATLKNETTGATNGQFSAGEKFKMPASGVVLTAVYDATKYTIKFSTSGGPASVTPATPDMEFTMEAANPNQTFASVSGAGYGFGGWEYNGKSYADIDAVRSDTRNGTITLPSSKEITLAAKWTVNSYGITYSAGSGVTAISNTMPTDVASQGYNTTVTITTTPKRQGYTFNGWDSSVSGTTVTQSGSNYSFTMPASAITLTAKWTEMTELNVSASGNDTTGDGSSTSPFATVKKAITVAKTLTGTNLTIKVNGTVSFTLPITFDASDKNITLMGTNNGILKRGNRLTYLEFSSGNVTLQDITIDGNKDGGIISSKNLLYMRGTPTTDVTVTMETGTVIQNHNGNELRCAAVAVETWSTFIMNDGAIQNNENTYDSNACGGVCIAGGNFEMYGGSITDNKANGTSVSVGGIYSHTDASSCIIAGGSITNNTSNKIVGGILARTLTIGSSDPSKNGVITIKNNYLDSDPANPVPSNVVPYAKSSTLTMQAEPASSSEIGISGISTGTTGYPFTTGWQNSWNKNVFVSDVTGKSVEIDADTGELNLQ